MQRCPAYCKTNPSVGVLTAPVRCSDVAGLRCYTLDWSLDPVTISLRAGWAVTPASGPTGRRERYRAGSRWPSWCHTESQIGFNCQGRSLAQWVCGGRGTPWVAGLKIGPDEDHCDLIRSSEHSQHISHTCGSQTHAGMKQWRSPQGYLWGGGTLAAASVHFALIHCLHHYGYRTHAHTQMHSHALPDLSRPWLRSRWQQRACCSDVSVLHCMSCPVCFCLCSQR